jgi:hypothetical protein
MGVVPFTTRPSRTTWNHPSPNSFCSAKGSARLAFGAVRCYCLVAPGSRPHCKDCLHLLPFHTAPVVRCVVASIDSEERLRWKGWTNTRDVRALTRDVPRSVAAVRLRMAEALAEFVLYRALCCNVRIHQDSDAAEFGEGPHPRHLRAS